MLSGTAGARADQNHERARPTVSRVNRLQEQMCTEVARGPGERTRSVLGSGASRAPDVIPTHPRPTPTPGPGSGP